LLLVIALVALAGCKSGKPLDAPLPKQPDAPTKPDAVATLGKDLDKTDHRVASALVAIEKNADKPKVVVAESRLAQSYLPAPPQGDVEFALARASRAETPQGAIDYARQMAFGRQLATAVTKAWERLEADQAEAKRVSGLKDARIVELQAEVERVKKDASAQTWTWIGGALAVAGALCTAFLGPRVGLPLIGCGMLCGAVPFIIESEYFSIIVATTLAGCACLLLWYIFDKVSDAVQDKKDEAEISKDE
jgi:hypothetical protein